MLSNKLSTLYKQNLKKLESKKFNMKTKNRKKESPNYRDVSISIIECSVEI